MPTAASIIALADADGRLEVRVSPSASADTITLPASEGALAVRTTAPPENGKANDAVLRVLAKALNRPVSTPELVRGVARRNKLIRLTLLPRVGRPRRFTPVQLPPFVQLTPYYLIVRSAR